MNNVPAKTSPAPDHGDMTSYQGRLWITRPRPGVDRMASAWLIRRFIDPQARFGFAADRQSVPHHGVPFDMFGVEFSHQGDGCTFETLCSVFGLREPAIGRIAAIVHDLDLKDARFGAPEGAAVGAMIEGLQLAYTDDDALLSQGMILFDSLYRSFEQSVRAAGPRPLARADSARTPDPSATPYQECQVMRFHDEGSTPMRRTILFVPWFVVGMSLVMQGATRKVDFSDDAVGQAPKGFEFGHTAKAGRPGKWVVQAEGRQQIPRPGRCRQHALALSCRCLGRRRPPRMSICPYDSSRCPAASIRQPGLVWRFQNEDNYYLVRANALENNVVLYKVENGKRTDLPVKGEGRTYGKEGAGARPGQWSTLRVVAAGPRFEVFFNGNKLYEVEDATFTRPGKVGVWTKADSVTQFDDLTVVTK